MGQAALKGNESRFLARDVRRLLTLACMSFVTLVLAAVGLAVLSYGADVLVRGAGRLARAVGVSPLVVGLTVVAFGTSAPELVVSVQAAAGGTPGLAVGNVVGSNIFNVLFILGLASIITPLVVARQLVRIDVPVLIVASGAVWLMSLDGALGYVDGILLTAGVVAYTAFAIRQGRRESKRETVGENASEPERSGERRPSIWMDSFLVVVGLVMLVVGSRLFVAGAVLVARWLGVSDLVIGLTIVAAGTSLPEVAASIAASLKGERDIAVGNVIGSNLFNLLCVLGVSALVSRGGLPVAPEARAFDIPVMVVVAVACLPIFFAGHLVTRREGGAFLAGYVAYVLYLVLAAQNHPWLPAYGRVLVFVALPVVLATLALVAVREWRTRHREKTSG